MPRPPGVEPPHEGVDARDVREQHERFGLERVGDPNDEWIEREKEAGRECSAPRQQTVGEREEDRQGRERERVRENAAEHFVESERVVEYRDRPRKEWELHLPRIPAHPRASRREDRGCRSPRA